MSKGGNDREQRGLIRRAQRDGTSAGDAGLASSTTATASRPLRNSTTKRARAEMAGHGLLAATSTTGRDDTRLPRTVLLAVTTRAANGTTLTEPARLADTDGLDVAAELTQTRPHPIERRPSAPAIPLHSPTLPPPARRTSPSPTPSSPQRSCATTSREADQRLAAVLAAAGEPSRLKLLRLLLEQQRCVAECVEHTGLGQSLVSKHLSRLIGAGLVQRRRSGRRNYHSVLDPQGVREILSVTERLAHASHTS